MGTGRVRRRDEGGGRPYTLSRTPNFHFHKRRAHVARTTNDTAATRTKRPAVTSSDDGGTVRRWRLRQVARRLLNFDARESEPPVRTTSAYGDVVNSRVRRNSANGEHTLPERPTTQPRPGPNARPSRRRTTAGRCVVGVSRALFAEASGAGRSLIHRRRAGAWEGRNYRRESPESGSPRSVQ